MTYPSSIRVLKTSIALGQSPKKVPSGKPISYYWFASTTASRCSLTTLLPDLGVEL